MSSFSKRLKPEYLISLEEIVPDCLLFQVRETSRHILTHSFINLLSVSDLYFTDSFLIQKSLYFTAVSAFKYEAEIHMTAAFRIQNVTITGL